MASIAARAQAAKFRCLPEIRSRLRTRRLLAKRVAASIQNGPRQGIGPEVAQEEIVRALMAVRANTMIYEAASPALIRHSDRDAEPARDAGGSIARLAR